MGLSDVAVESYSYFSDSIVVIDVGSSLLTFLTSVIIVVVTVASYCVQSRSSYVIIAADDVGSRGTVDVDVGDSTRDGTSIVGVSMV